MKSIEVIAGIRIRPLSQEQRAEHFRSRTPKLDLTPYLAVLREMEGDIAYAIGLNGVTIRSTKVRYAKADPGATELVIELA